MINKNTNQQINTLDILVEGIKAIKDEIKTCWDNLSKNIKLDEIAEIACEKLDKEIILCKNKGLKYCGGKFYIDKQNDYNQFVLSYELWFLNNGKYIKASNKSIQMDMKDLHPESFSELNNKKHIEYEIEEPKNNQNIF